MKQYKQIGKPTKKEDYLNSKVNKIFISPSGKEYLFNYKKENKKYIYIISYKDFNCQIKESEFNKIGIETLLKTMDKSINEII